MKNIFRYFTVLLFSLSAQIGVAQTIDLDEGWECQSSAVVSLDGVALSQGQTSSASWYPTRVPTTVMGALVRNGEYPKILERDNYRRYDNRRFMVPWFFRKSFRLENFNSQEHVRLLFEGIDYRADVFLNGRQVASCDTVAGPFRTFVIDVTGIAQEQNTLVVKTYRCQPGEYNIGFVDWNPRPLDESMGIVRPVKVQRSGAVVIESPRVRTQVNLTTMKEAWVEVEVTLRNLSDHEVTGQLSCSFECMGNTVPVTLQAGQTKTLTFNAQNYPALHVMFPRLWWCYTMGKPEMYSLQLQFKQDNKTTVSDNKVVRFGIREVGSYITSEGYRAFTLNGKRIQLLGAGWTDDIFLRDDAESYDRQLELVKQMNLNTVRLEGFWGTSQALYDLCDEKGILLLAGWSCFWEWEDYLGKPCDELYGGILTDEDVKIIAQEYDDQLRYLRNHPSIIAWFVGSDKLPVPQLEHHYAWAQKNIDDRPYIISAKQMESDFSGASGTKMAGPYDYVAPAYWYREEAPGGAFGFNTETGIGAQLPVKESLRQMLGDKLWPLDSVWDYHCTSAAEAFNSLKILKETVDGRYGQAKNLDDFLRKANMVNYDGTKAMFEAFRYNSPKATALVQWMLNSARPSLYWQLYDYYLRPNAAFYAVRKACNPIQLIYNHHQHDIRAVNSHPYTVDVTVEQKLYGVNGNLINHEKKEVTIPPLSSVPAFDPVSLGTEENGYLFLTCEADGKLVAENEYALARTEDVHDWEKTDWTRTPILKFANYKAIGNQVQPQCQISIDSSDGERVSLIVSNPTDRVAYMQRIVFTDKKGIPIDGVTYSDNYISIPPHGTKNITCVLPREMKFKVRITGNF